MYCNIPDCYKVVENQDTGLCASHGRYERKLQKKYENHDANKERPARTFIPLPKRTRSQQESYYKRRVREWKKDKDCALIGQHGPCNGPLTCHHQKGRIGDLLLDEKYWLPVCAWHHFYIERHPQESYEKGWSLLRTQTEPHTI